ncbi:MAG: hypothetical protein WA883_12660 [Phormidesmis sp.]
MAYAPDVWSSYVVYAGVAARVACTLSAYDSQLATVYQKSALQAMAYTEANYVANDYTTGEKLHNVGDQRNLAALELYRLTRDSQWHDLFLPTTHQRLSTSCEPMHSQASRIICRRGLAAPSLRRALSQTTWSLRLAWAIAVPSIRSSLTSASPAKLHRLALLSTALLTLISMQTTGC